MNVQFLQLREIFDTRQVRDVLSVYIYNLHRIDFRRCQYAVAATGDVRLDPFAERCVREVRLVNGHRLSLTRERHIHVHLSAIGIVGVIEVREAGRNTCPHRRNYPIPSTYRRGTS